MRGTLRGWVDDLAMGARFACGGGREGWTRTLLTAVGVGLGVTVLLVAASVPNMIRSAEARESARIGQAPSQQAPGQQAQEEEAGQKPSLLVAVNHTEFRGQSIRGRLLEAQDGGESPVPPGLSRIPESGELVASPALKELLTSPEGKLLRERLPGEITDTIGKEGLIGPQELTYYAGGENLERYELTQRVTSFGGFNDDIPPAAILILLITVACVVLLLPVAAFVAAAVRFGGERRDRRLAALRLVGADARQTRRVAGGEAAAGALFGLAVGTGLFLILRQFVSLVGIRGLSYFPSDVTPGPVLVTLIVLAVPGCAVTVSLLALRGVTIEPLGVMRHAGVRRRRLWWRLLLPAAGIGLLAPMLDGVTGGPAHGIPTWRISGGIALTLLGVTALLPWLLETGVRRLHGGPLSFQLAVRRLQLDSGTASRAVSGITVAVAGATALQLLFGAVQADQTSRTGADTSRAQLLVRLPVTDTGGRTELTKRLERTRGVRDTLGVSRGTAGLPGEKGDISYSVTVAVADCSALRELLDLSHCENGDVFRAPADPEDDALLPKPGEVLDLAYTDPLMSDRDLPPELWTLPKDTRRAKPGTTPSGLQVAGVLATPAALDITRLPRAETHVYVSTDPAVEDALEYARNTAVGVSLWASPRALTDTEQTRQFAAIERGIYAASIGLLLLIGAGMVVTTLEQLRERKRLLSVLVAFGTNRSTLGWSVLWQTALPIVLGLVLAAGTGLGLGVVLLEMAGMPIVIGWSGPAALSGLGGALILLVTLISMPALWRMMRPDGLRTE